MCVCIKKRTYTIPPLYLAPFFCVQMSIESEMSHQRFRFLLQSGVWHLFSYFVILVSCAACVGFQMHEYATMLFWHLAKHNI